MKSFTRNLMVAAAALMVVAGSASAQVVLKAEIPFGFTAGDAKLAPGTYQLTMQSPYSGSPVLHLFHTDSGRSVKVIAVRGYDEPRSRKPTLSFACLNGRYTLKTVWNGAGVSELSVPAGKHNRAELAEVEIINIRAVKAD